MIKKFLSILCTTLVTASLLIGCQLQTKPTVSEVSQKKVLSDTNVGNTQTVTTSEAAVTTNPTVAVAQTQTTPEEAATVTGKPEEKETSTAEAKAEQTQPKVEILLQKGDSGQEVKDLQKKLYCIGYDISVDGRFGQTTVKAVSSFQQKYILTVDGILDKPTKDKLDTIKDVREYAVPSPKPVQPKTPNPAQSTLPSLPADFYGIPVLMYHSISVSPGNELCTPPERFEAEMAYLKDNGYTTLTMQEVYDAIYNGKVVPKKSIAITLDDGYEDNYTNAYPILKKYGFKATIFIITGVFNEGWTVTPDQMLEMYQNGIDFESHTVTHRGLSSLSYSTQLTEMKNSKTFLENLLHKKITTLCYPSGIYDDNTLKAAKEAGYLMAYTTKDGLARRDRGMFTLPRVRVSASISIDTFTSKITRQR